MLVLPVEVGLLAILHRLGSLPFLSTPGRDASAWWVWLQHTPAEDAVASGLRLVALGCSYWLLATTLLYAAARLGRIPALLPALRWTTPAPVRRIVDRALAASVVAALAGGGPALAATTAPPTPPAPVVAVVGGKPGLLIPPGAAPSSPPAPVPEGPAPVQAAERHRVVRGDNLWAISAARLDGTGRGQGRSATGAQIASYWRKVIEANRSALRSGNPNLIFPGETITLPPAT